MWKHVPCALFVVIWLKFL